MSDNGGKNKSSDRSTRTRGYGNSNGIEWHNPKPSAKDVKWLDSHESDYGKFVLEVFEGVEDNERLSLKYDTESTRWIAVLFVDPDESGGKVQALSVRASTPLFAVVLLYYFDKHPIGADWRAPDVEVAGRFG